MTDIITLSSSDEEDVQPIKKKIKPIAIGEVSITLTPKKTVSPVVILSDDDTESDDTKICQSDQPQIGAVASVIKYDSSLKLPNHQTNDTICDTNLTDSVQNGNHINGTKENEESDGIIIDENSSGDTSGKENKSGNNVSKINVYNEPSTSAASLIDDTLLEKFLKVCGESVKDSQYEHLEDEQFPILRKYYSKCSGKLSDSSSFLQLIDENIVRAQKSAATAVISFNEILQYVKEIVNAESIDVSKDERIRLKKLEKVIKLLLRKIKHLENLEVNFDAEEDSVYLQLERYINRLNKVHKKYCELLEKNPYSGRITHEKLDFVHSEYNEINRAICKKYKNNEKFPSYYEMEQYIRKIVSEHKLDLTEHKIKSESILCFKKLGELLQMRRKKDLYDSHYLYIRDTEDPANDDTSLDSTLKQNFTDGQVKIEKICEEFRIKEELGEETVLSEEDSDKSNEGSSEEDNEN